MSQGNIYLSKRAFEKLEEDLNYLKTVKRREISKEIGKAREHGDISENAEYDAAKEAQGFLEKKIADLEDKFSRARIIDNENIPDNEVLIGATVKLKDLDTGEELEYTLVSELEADFSLGRISIASPIGQHLLGHKEKEKVEIKVPAGILKYKIMKISRSPY